MSRRTAPKLLVLVSVVMAVPARAIEIVSERERRELELQRKRQAAPVLRCGPSSLSASLEEGRSRTLRLTVRNAGGQTLRWSLTSAPAWVSLDSREGTLAFEQERRITVTVRSAGLEPGTKRGTIVIEAAGAAGSPARIPVSVYVREAPEEEVDVEEEPEEEPREEPVRRPGRRARFASRAAERAERPPRERAPEREGRVAPGGLGVWVGVALPSSGEVRDIDTVPLFGMHYRFGGNGGASLSYEVGVDVGTQTEKDGYQSLPVGGRFDVRYALGEGGNGDGGPSRFFLLGGYEGFVEFVTRESDGSQHTNTASALNLGGGVAFADGRFDIRLRQAIFLGSENLQGQTLLAISYCF